MLSEAASKGPRHGINPRSAPPAATALARAKLDLVAHRHRPPGGEVSFSKVSKRSLLRHPLGRVVNLVPQVTRRTTGCTLAGCRVAHAVEDLDRAINRLQVSRAAMPDADLASR